VPAIFPPFVTACWLPTRSAPAFFPAIFYCLLVTYRKRARISALKTACRLKSVSSFQVYAAVSRHFKAPHFKLRLSENFLQVFVKMTKEQRRIPRQNEKSRQSQHEEVSDEEEHEEVRSHEEEAEVQHRSIQVSLLDF